MNVDKNSIIFLVERSLPMKLYIPELIEAYISPALNNFCGELNEDTDVFFKQSSPVQFGVIFFSSEFHLGNRNGQLISVGPTPSSKEVLSAIKNARYTCENTTRQACIIEGLNAASTFFTQLDQMAARRAAAGSCVTGSSNNNSGSSNTNTTNSGKKLAILITQSAPLHHPWVPASLDQTLKSLKMNGIKLSVLACHKLPELYRIYETCGGDLNVASHKNYASRPQHLVLLSGFTLPEHDNPPITHTNTSTASAAVGQSPANTSLQQQQQSPASNTMNQSPQQQIPASSVGAVGSPAAHHQQQQPQIGNQGMRGNMGGMSPMSQPTGMSRGNVGSGNVMMRPTGVNMPGQRAKWQSPMTATNQQQQDGSIANKVGMVSQQTSQGGSMQQSQQGLGVPSTLQGNTAGAGSAAASQRSVVWQGTLELQDKKEMLGPLENNRIPCKMTTQMVNNEPEVNTEGWPQNLVLQLIPKSILSCLGNSYFKNVHTVMFLPEQCPALTMLTNNLSRAMAGCVHPSGSNTNVRMIILLFSAEKKAYVGFIPIDQVSFIAKMKTVISTQRGVMPGSAMIRPNAPSIGGGGGMTGGQMAPIVSGMGVMGNQGGGVMGAGGMSGQMGPLSGASGPQSALASQLIRPGGGMGPMQQQDQQQGQYQQPMPGVRQPMGQSPGGMAHMRPMPGQGVPMAGQGGRPNLMQSQMGAQGNQRMMALMQQQQMQQQQQMMMMQQQGMRPNLGQGGMGPQGGMGTQGGIGSQGGMGQVGMGQVMGQSGMGGALPPDGQDFMDMI